MDKDKIIFTCITIIIIAFIIFIDIICTTGCQSTANIDDRNGRAAISTIARLEEQISQLDRELETITTGAESLETDISRFGREFTTYVRYVQRMRAIIEEYGISIEANQD